MGRRIHIDFRKWPDHLHWQFEMDYLGEDAHGVWLWRAGGWTARRGSEAPKHMSHLAVKVIPDDDWWTAIWNDTDPVWMYVDIITPPQWDGDRVTMIDLDLDLGRRGDETVVVHDEDEFLENQVKLGYPEPLVARASAATARVKAAVESGAEPFGTSAAGWLQIARELASGG